MTNLGLEWSCRFCCKHYVGRQSTISRRRKHRVGRQSTISRRRKYYVGRQSTISRRRKHHVGRQSVIFRRSKHYVGRQSVISVGTSILSRDLILYDICGTTCEQIIPSHHNIALLVYTWNNLRRNIVLPVYT